MAEKPNDSRPTPDPTVLTTEQLERGLTALRSIIEARLDGYDKLIEIIQNDIKSRKADIEASVHCLEEVNDTRFTAMDKAIDLLQKFADKSPTTFVLEQQVASLEALVTEQLRGVQIQFIERDKRTEQLSIADKTAIAAALQAQKEAAGAQAEGNAASTAKQEMAFTKLIEQIQQTQSATNKSTDDKINALTGRLDRGEGQSKGSSDLWGYIVGGIGVLISVVTVVTLVITRLR